MTDSPAPKPRPVPKPAPRPAAAAAPAQPSSEALIAAMNCGRADDEGNVYLTTSKGEVVVGQYPSASKEQALEFYARRFLEHASAVDLLEERLAAGTKADDIIRSVEKARNDLDEARVVGDVEGLKERLDKLEKRAKDAAKEQAADHEKAREEGVQKRMTVIERAEELIAQAPGSIHWKNTSAKMNELFDEWKDIQKSFPRIPRAQDTELWDRFKKARGSFEKMRREFFAELDKRSAEGKKIKEKIVEEAEQLADSTAWRETSSRFRDLMSQWKASPRAQRKDDDKLWERFRSAQDKFFGARSADQAERDEEYRGNLEVKEELLAQAKALLPIEDHKKAKQQLRTIQDKWEEAGPVPRADISRMENGLREVERAIEDAEQAEWKRTDPDKQDRASGMLAQLEQQTAQLKEKADKAEADGDSATAAKLRDELATKEQWLEQLRRTAADFS